MAVCVRYTIATQILQNILLFLGMERPAVTCYKDVLKLCPLALDAAQSLMALGTKPKEVQELTLEATEGRQALLLSISFY